MVERRCIRSTLAPKKPAGDVFNPVGYYDENTDIRRVHDYVLQYFADQRKSATGIQEKIKALEVQLAQGKMYANDIHAIQRKIAKYTQDLDEIMAETKKKEYLEKAAPILDKYTKLKDIGGPTVFGESKKSDPERLGLVRSFIQLASMYTPLSLMPKPYPAGNTCPYCRQRFTIDDEGRLICYECDIYRDAFIRDTEYSDVERVSIPSSSYVNKETFERAKKCYQGRQQVDFPPDLFTRFDEYCAFHKKNKRLLTYETTRPIFKEIGYPEYYEDINLFLSLHPEIRRPLPDISKYEELIDRDYDKFYQKFIEIKGDERDSALNSWYLLYILLRRRGIPCNVSDFKLPETASIRVASDNISRKVFAELGWVFEDTI